MKFADRLKDLRAEKEMSRETLASAIGVHRRAIGFWEDGINEPKASYIIRLAQYFGVTTDYLLGLED